MTYAEFVSGEPAQRRYWAGSHVGWARMRGALTRLDRDATRRWHQLDDPA